MALKVSLEGAEGMVHFTNLVNFLVLHLYTMNFSLFPYRFQANMVTYQNLITKSMYDKQLDSGKGTLLHLCDDVIQQEVCNPHYLDKFNLSCVSNSILKTIFAG
jgi:hypothetical protein